MRTTLLTLLITIFSLGAQAQHMITGRVQDKQKNTLAGAVVHVKELDKATITDPNGEFTIKNLNKGDYTLEITFIGFEKAEYMVEVPNKKPLKITLSPSLESLDEVLVEATRAGEKAPFTYSNVSKESLEERNTGQDLPYLLNNTPSLVVTSDAGTGIGYTSMKIRGTDQSRINITIDGIPLNDAESQGVFWVNMPDMGSSVENIQVQRGVGTSTNGAAAFGATVNIQTAAPSSEPYAEVQSMGGSFATTKNTLKAGTGLINNRFSVDVRGSLIHSDGFIDRASSDLQSLFFAAGYYGDKDVVRFNAFTGIEKTYQAWSGVPLDSLNAGNRTYNPEGKYTDADGNIKYYDDQTDNYHQTHYQLFYTHIFNEEASLNFALHTTIGDGYYQSYKDNKKPSSFGITTSDEKMDFITQKWLDNIFYGFTTSYRQNFTIGTLVVGGALNKYDGDHFGKILWAEKVNVPYEQEWYRGNGTKIDGNVYAKFTANITEELSVMGDLQYRNVDYTISGIDDNMEDIGQSYNYNFFNPKVGLYYQLSENLNSYASFAIAHKEPKRTDFVDAPNDQKPTPEKLADWELGLEGKFHKFQFGVNLYYMNYTDQLVNTGKLNNVGSTIMINTPDSYRAGVEITAGARVFDWMDLSGNISLSKNKIQDFVSYTDQYDENWVPLGEQKREDLGETDIAYSPNVVGNIMAKFHINDQISIDWISQYVGKQYLDNTSSEDRKLDAYSFTNLKATYDFTIRPLKQSSIWFQANNIFNQKYESNGWVYSYYLGGERNNSIGLYPQAGANWAIGLTLRL
ncbi:TonB-dependent receptor [Halosquirtibacter laminarini]|uniref:TonB-dependent receptor n=1 Tax=Halosquirtibacter laminarini TaxID=3374600 RepID=A0AC61NQX6_9BACT|nr:TonB-dependent receptor [Prolixibacteraceae bacterium]